jgi:hypothetical protein
MLDVTGRDDARLPRAREKTVLECEPGVVRLFGLADIGISGQLDGWAEPEEGHLWNDGQEAKLLLAVRTPAPRLMLHIGGEPYVTRVRPAQEITLFGNGLRIGYWRLTRRVETTLSVLLEPEWWLRRGSRAVMRLALHLPNSTRPSDIADGPDARELGFCFRSICLQPLPDGPDLAA